MQEEMHEQMSGYKRMRREHQGALVRIGKIEKVGKIDSRLKQLQSLH